MLRVNVANPSGLARVNMLTPPAGVPRPPGQASAPTPPVIFIEKNIADYGAVGDGVTNDWPSFRDFRTFARTQTDPIRLTVPPGSYRFVADNDDDCAPFDGIKQIYVAATGATFLQGPSGEGVRMASVTGFSQTAGTTARVAAVIAGATSLTCLTPAEAAFFPVGRWCALGALEWQGSSGYPPNLQYVQFVKVLSANPASGAITFTPPATQNYSAAYPFTKSAGPYDPGGPATLYLLISPPEHTGNAADGFEIDLTVDGLTFASTGQEQLYSNGRSVYYKNCMFTNVAPVPTCNVSFRMDNCTVTGIQIEVDKDIENYTLNDCHIRSIEFQSAAPTQTIITNTVFENFFNGTPRNLNVTGCTMNSLILGALGYGATDGAVVFTDTHVATTLDWASGHRFPTSDFSFAAGNLTYTAPGVCSLGAPGAPLFLRGAFQGATTYEHVGLTRKVTALNADGSNNPVMTVAFPTLAPPYITADAGVAQHPCPNITITNCTGALAPFSDGPPAKPIYSYCKMRGTFETEQVMGAWGTLVSIRVNVIRAYTGAQPTAMLKLSRFDNGPVISPDGTTGSYSFAFDIDTKFPGERTITPGSISGRQGNDSLTPPAAVWFLNGIGPIINANMTGDTPLQKPDVLVEIITDQGI